MNFRSITKLLSALLFAAALAAPVSVWAQDHDDHGHDDHGHDDFGEPVDAYAEDDHHDDDHAAHGDEHGAHGDDHGDHGEHHAAEPAWNELIAAIINFSLYIVLIFVFGRKPIQNYFAARRADVADNIEKSRELHEAAEAKLAELNAKLGDFEKERETLLKEYREIGEAEKERIIAEAKEAAAKIRKDAELRVEQDSRGARAKVETKLVDTALSMARQKVDSRLDASTQQRLIDATIRELGQSRSSAGA